MFASNEPKPNSLQFVDFYLFASGKYDGPGKGLASRACNWYINSRPGFRVSMSLEFFSVEGDPPSKFILPFAIRHSTINLFV